MTVKELMDQLSAMAPNIEVFLAISQPNDDSGDEDHYMTHVALEYPGSHFHGDLPHVQIKGS